MTSYFTRMSLSDLLDRTARLSGKVFVRGLLLGIVTMLPAGIVLGFAMREIFAALADTIVRTAHNPVADVSAVIPMFYGLTEFAIAMLLYMLGTIILQTAVIDMVDAEVHAAPRTWQGAFTRGWNAAFRVLWQYVLIFFIISSMVLFAVAFGIGVLQYWAFAALLIIAAVAAALWLLINWSLGAQAVVCEHDRAVMGLARSRMLVRGHWWRVFGIFFLFAVLTQFAVMIVTVPLQGMAMASVLPDMLDMQKQMLGNPNDVDALVPMLLKMSAFGWQLGLLQAVSGALVGIVQGVYSTLIYYDLRARNGEFDPEPVVQEPGVPA